MSESEIEKLKKVKIKNRDNVMKLANVTGIGVGRKRVGDEVTETLAIRVYVVKKLPIEKLKKEDIIPSELDGVPTDVVEIGNVRFMAWNVFRNRPAEGGESLSNCGHHHSGTLGGVFIDNTDGSEVILTNNHVIANCDTNVVNLANAGDNVVQPGEGDCGDCGPWSADIIATLKRWVEFVLPPAWNDVDAAIAEVQNTADVSRTIRYIGTRTGHRTLTAADVGTTTVQKSGRTTRLTYGTVADIALDVGTTTWQGDTIWFQDQILIEPIDTPVCLPGDSGSLVLDNSRKVVGLLWGGSCQGWMVASHITNVCTDLDIRHPGYTTVVCRILWDTLPCLKDSPCYLLSICIPLIPNIERERGCYKQIGDPMCPNITPVPGRYAFIDLERIPKNMKRQVDKMMDEIQEFRKLEGKK